MIGMHDFEYVGTLEVLRNITRNKGKNAIVAMSGVMRGAVGGGQVTALEKHSLKDNFSLGVGISTGAPIVAYFLSGQAEQGTGIYYQDLPANDFISISRAISHKKIRDIVDLQLLESLFRGTKGQRALDLDKFRKARADFYAVVTNMETEEAKCINAKQMHDPVKGIMMSCAMPGITNASYYYDGSWYGDGAMSCMLPHLSFFEKNGVDNILILANRPNIFEKDIKNSFFDHATTYWLKKKNLPGFGAKYHKAYVTMFERIRYLLESDINILILFHPENLLSAYSMNSDDIKKAALQAEEHLDSLIKAVL